MYCALALCMFLLQSFWGGLNFFQQWSENSVDEIDLSCGLGAFEYEICCITNDGLNFSIDAPTFEETLLGGIWHLKNNGCNLSVGAASFDALLDGITKHFNEDQVIYIYLHAKLFVHGLYNTTEDLSELEVDKLAQHLNSVSALYYLFHIRSCATSTQGHYSGSGPGLQATSTEFHLL